MSVVSSPHIQVKGNVSIVYFSCLDPLSWRLESTRLWYDSLLISDFMNEGLRGCPSLLVIRGCCAIYSCRTDSQQKPQWPQIIQYVVSLDVKQIAHSCPKHCFQVLFLFWHTGSIDYSSHQDKWMKMFARLCQHRVPKGRENRCFITLEISHFFEYSFHHNLSHLRLEFWMFSLDLFDS